MKLFIAAILCATSVLAQDASPTPDPAIDEPQVTVHEGRDHVDVVTVSHARSRITAAIVKTARSSVSTGTFDIKRAALYQASLDPTDVAGWIAVQEIFDDTTASSFSGFAVARIALLGEIKNRYGQALQEAKRLQTMLRAPAPNSRSSTSSHP